MWLAKIANMIKTAAGRDKCESQFNGIAEQLWQVPDAGVTGEYYYYA
jgi:hypothetical protein